jgi:uncharacterized membrane protein
MGKNRLETFTDAVLGVVITITVLLMKVPDRPDFVALRPVLPVFLSYVVSFLYIAIYWNNHHHLLSLTKEVNWAILWANLHLLFWLSLVPFTTAWMGENGLAPAPTALYGVVLLMVAVAYFVLQLSIVAQQGRSSALAQAVGRDIKGKASPFLYAAAIPVAYLFPPAGFAMYVLLAALWLIPSRRIERRAASGSTRRSD